LRVSPLSQKEKYEAKQRKGGGMLSFEPIQTRSNQPRTSDSPRKQHKKSKGPNL
jgi:hypothetical protein